ALRYLRSGAPSTTLNCGYGRGYSVREVIDAVKRLSGIDFATEKAQRRAGDPAALVAATTKIRQTLAWQPRFAELSTIVAHALAWERALLAGSSGRTAPIAQSSF